MTLCARTATLWGIVRFMGMAPRSFDNRKKKSPAAQAAGYIDYSFLRKYSREATILGFRTM